MVISVRCRMPRTPQEGQRGDKLFPGGGKKLHIRNFKKSFKEEKTK